jgi:predicted ATPase
MLSKLRVQHYKSLFDTEVDLEPLTVFIGPNGSGKSNICESLAVLSNFLQRLIDVGSDGVLPIKDFFAQSLQAISQNSQSLESKFWHGQLDYLAFNVKTFSDIENTIHQPFPPTLDLYIYLDYPKQTVLIEATNKNSISPQPYVAGIRNFLVFNQYLDSPLANALKQVRIYDFAPTALSSPANNPTSANSIDRTGQGIADALIDVLHSNRDSFDELEERLTQLVPNIKRISLPRKNDQTFALELIDRYSEHHIPASDISDGTLRILAFLTALYQENTPSIICFEEIENGVHPWLLHKMMELLKIISTEGITGQPVQVLITTHSPVLLNYVEPHQVRAVELDAEGKTQVHALPIESTRFQKALEAYDGALGELWFTNVFGGNPG